MKVLLCIITALFSFITYAQNFNYVGLETSNLINIENLEEIEECTPYMNDQLPSFSKNGMIRLVREFSLEEGVNAILSDYTCNINLLFYWENNKGKNTFTIVKSYRASGGRGAVSNVKKSGGTPPGVHYIHKIQGETEGWPLNYAIDGYKYGYRSDVIVPTQDFTFWKPKFVMTRILRMKGLEGEINNNSVARSILIHGTPEEGLLGYHESGGCIRMNNQEVIDLSNQVVKGTFVNVVFSEANKKIVRNNRNYLEKDKYKQHKLICVDQEKCKDY